MRDSEAVPTLPAIGTAAAAKWQAPPTTTEATSVTALEKQYFKAISLFRRRNYEKCVDLCTAMLRAGHEGNVQMFASSPDAEDEEDDQHEGSSTMYSSNLQRISAARPQARQGRQKTTTTTSTAVKLPTWIMEGVWQLKMRALTQRVYVDDLETNDNGDDAVNEEVEFGRIATAARPGTSIKNFLPRPRTSTTAQNRHIPGVHSSNGRAMSARPLSGMARPGTSLSRPGSSMGNRPASRCGTASRVRATSAAAYTVGDATAALYQASRLNPTIYAERKVLVKALFQFLFYHESDVQKAHSLCEAVMEVHKQKRTSAVNDSDLSASSFSPGFDWWWYQQMGRCLLALRYPRKAEPFLKQSLAMFSHPDTYLLLSRLYQRLEQPKQALELINTAVDRYPFDLTFRTEQARVFDAMSDNLGAMQIWRLIAKLNPINIESLACIALSYFYENNPEMALMYYRRILSLGVHTPELYCNIALCCLYGGQIDLVLPCFQRALITTKTPDQRANIWYNLSFVAITTGDFNLARRCLQLCLTSDARNGAALNNLAVLSAHGADILKAKSYLTAAKEVLTDSVEIENNLKYMEAHYKL